jgi:choline dehydrogenase-like flavoprotein
MVYQVVMDPTTHRAKGLMYVDRHTREVHEVYGKVVVLCAQALESARILLNSATEQAPNGLGNSSGVLGHYLMDHLWVAGGAFGAFPDLPGDPSLSAAHRPNGAYVIRFRNTANGERSKKFVRGYGFQGGGAANFNFDAPGFGEAYKQKVKEGNTGVNLVGFGECLPYFENFIAIDKNAVDAYGIPTLRITMAWGENEKAMIPDMAESASEMLEASGAKGVMPFSVLDRIPGYGIHEVGVARMGADPKTSVLNQYQQTHDVKNLFVMDGACFPSSACQNPTLTIMSLAVRSSDYLMEELKKGNL